MSITGTVKFFNSDKGYGFIAPDNGGGDAFVHISAVERAGMATLNQDQRVSYELEQDKRGKMAAVNLQAADRSATGGAHPCPARRSRSRRERSARWLPRR